jgi:multidrug efflux system membrane fusion protein
MHRLPKSVLTAALILLILVGYFGLRTATRPETIRQTASTVVEGEADLTRPAVQVRRAHPVTHTIFANFKGRTEANRSVTVRSETAGSVETTPVREGQIVNTGALLCGLAVDSRAARIAEAEAAVEASRLEYEAAATLLERGWTTSPRAAALRAAQDQAEAAMAAAEIELSRTRLTAPFKGVFERRDAEVGDFLAPGAACGQVVDLDPIVIAFETTEDNRSKLAIGTAATATLSDGRQMEGSISFIARAADAGTRTFRVELEVPNADFEIAAGLTSDVRLILGETEAVPLTPASLILHDDGRVGVRYVDATSVVQFSEVTVIDDVDTGIWVTGIPAGAALLVEGQGFIREGTQVEPLDVEAS